MKKVFFACSMRGGFPYVSQKFLRQIPNALEEIGLELMSKHQTQQGIIGQENQRSTIEIHDRDYSWIEKSDLVIAEISNPSDGAGGEIADAYHLKKPTLGLYQRPEHEMSAYTRGKIEKNPQGHHTEYKSLEDLKKITKKFISDIFNT
ncbi:unnamed protein product [marine sediment metagenome]|uniref:2'-deoxynucleoside 5'-phosphate N-hydrolase 1 n=1 Tax=marine sediment metagenome TaxID=412755 RepID=X1KGL2_9ZZZZ